MKKTIVLSALVAAFALVGWIEKGMAYEDSGSSPYAGPSTSIQIGGTTFTNGPDVNIMSTTIGGTTFHTGTANGEPVNSQSVRIGGTTFTN